MDFKVGQVVLSLAGHDKGELLVVAGTENKKVLICDGKGRGLQNPKHKNPKHLEPQSAVLDGDSMATNRKIRKTLNKLIAQEG
ncbi:MAG: KOW domain-containing RNA-binding protein [Acutalibacteraceae bacterium]|nr:KOW domain-containing RNA-binding protein [Acutalibacteraceae bacterium]